MTATPHPLPLQLIAIAGFAADQPDLDILERALNAARLNLRLPDSLQREEDRQGFIAVEGEVHADIQGLPSHGRIAAQVHFGDAAFFYGLAVAWLLLTGKEGTR